MGSTFQAFVVWPDVKSKHGLGTNAVCVYWTLVKEFKWVSSLVKHRPINRCTGVGGSLNQWTVECFPVWKSSLNTPSSPANTDNLLRDVSLKLIGLTEQLMVYLLASRWQRRQDKSVASISEHVMRCLVLKGRSWIDEPSRLPGFPHCLCNPKDTVGKLQSHAKNVSCTKHKATIWRLSFFMHFLPILSFALPTNKKKMNSCEVNFTTFFYFLCCAKGRAADSGDGLTQRVNKEKLNSQAFLKPVRGVLLAVLDSKGWTHTVLEETTRPGP